MIVRPIVCRRFISRREELAFLHERRLLAGKSHGGVVLLAGEAGVGKSRLLSEFCAPLAKSRWRVGYGRCLEHAQRPYGPILDVLAAYGDTERSLLPEVSKREQFDAVVARFEQAASKTGLVAVIEDAHWGDVATLELLTFLAPRLERHRILLIASFRPHDVTLEDPTYAGLANLMRAARAGRIDLAPLDEPSLRLFIDEAVSGYPLLPETRHAVAQTSEGNPFFAEELLKSAVERLSSRAASGGDAGVLPSSLRATLLERWHQLTHADRRVIAQAAVIGRSFELPLLARSLDTDVAACAPALARARDIQLVEEVSPSLFRFRHALTREAIYGEFLGAQVVPLHRTIAACFETEPEERRSLESLAYHWWAAGDGARAARYNELAGDAAGAVHAHEDAIAFYERALEAATLTNQDRGRLVEKIGDRCYAIGWTDRIYASYGLAAEHFRDAADDMAEARCLTREALAAYTVGVADPTAPLEAMLGRLEPHAYLTRSRVHLGIAWLKASFWFPTESARQLALVDPRALDVPDLSLRYHNVAAWVAMTVGDLDVFRREFAAWRDAAENVSLTACALAHMNGAWCHSVFGLHEEAIALCNRALEITRAERNRHLEQSTQAFASICYLMSGDLAGTRAVLSAMSRASGNVITIAHAASSGMLAGLHLDDRELIATWFDGAGPSIVDAPEASCGAGFAELFMRRGRDAEARAVLHRAIPACEATRGIAWTLLAAAKYADPDDVARARALLVTAATAPVPMLETFALALFDAHVAHREGRHREAIPHARAAAEGFRRLRFPLFEAAAWEAAAEPEAALALYRAYGAAGDERRLTAALPKSPNAAASLASTPVATNGLSQRESEIAALVASGKSNVEIGRSLSISHKTVEKHLGSVYQKLGFSSRTQLAAYVAGVTRS